MALTVLVVAGYGSALVVSMTASQVLAIAAISIVCVVVTIGVAAIVVFGREWLADTWRRFRRPAADILVLGVLVAWGLVYNNLGHGCSGTGCRDNMPFRPLAEPEVFGLVGLHVLTVLAYTVSRRHPAVLHRNAELLPLSGVLAGTLEEPTRPREGIAVRPNPLLCEIWRRAVCSWQRGHSVSAEARMDCSASHSWAHAEQRYS